MTQLVLLFAILAAPMGATASAQDGRIAGRFAAPVATRVQALVDSAQREGLPTEPLVLRALEGHAKHIAPERIIDALGRLRVALRTARTTLGTAANSTELTTAAAALQAGVPEPKLAELHRLRGAASITAPLGAYLDLVALGAEPDRAWDRVSQLAKRRAGDAEYVRLRPRDLESGGAPSRTSSPLPGKP